MSRREIVGLRAALMAGCASILIATVAHAQSSMPVALDIPASDLETALNKLAVQSGQEIAFQSATVAGKRATAVKGMLTASQALSQLLQSSGLRARTSERGGLIVETAGPQDQWAQNEPKAVASVEEVVVTGSHIRGAKVTSPVHTVTLNDITNSGFSQVSDLVRSLPMNFAGGQNPGVQRTGGTVSQNITNSSLINLRGIGPDATLVLLNGNRLPADGNYQAPDISGIPMRALERIEIVTDGASALYGSDAVAGVVNFILRKNFNAVEVGARIGGATQGGGGEKIYNVLAGREWGTGSALLSVEYYDQDAIFASKRRITETVPPVTTLLGYQQRKSVFLNVSQDVSDAVVLAVDAMWTSRDSDQKYVLGAVGYAFDHQQFSNLVNPRIKLSLPKDWEVELRGSISRSKNDSPYSTTTGAKSRGTFTNYNRSVEVDLTGTLLSLPSGEVGVAFGGGYREEGMSFYTSSGAPSGDRAIKYFYGEASAPLISPDRERSGLNRLEVNLSGRLENYSDFGDTFNSKFGILYVPTSGVNIRGTVGTSFKAPTFYQLISPHTIFLYRNQTLGGANAGTSLLDFGGNPNLNPEKSRSWTVGFDYRPSFAPSLEISATYFNIQYKDRIAYPLATISRTFSDPNYASFILLNPTASQQALAIAGAERFSNLSGLVYNPDATTAIVMDRYTNVSEQDIDGWDLSLRNRSTLGQYSVDAYGSASYQKIMRKLVPSASAEQISGTLFNPPSLRFRAGVAVTRGGMSVSTALNYVSSEDDVAVVPTGHISSWTTFDMQIAYRFGDANSVFNESEILLSANNVFDKDPPYARGAGVGLAPGMNFDSTNSSAVGRFISLTIRKKF